MRFFAATKYPKGNLKAKREYCKNSKFDYDSVGRMKASPVAMLPRRE
jgi:hypothetical protein